MRRVNSRLEFAMFPRARLSPSPTITHRTPEHEFASADDIAVGAEYQPLGV
jgi:hypothetical protein